LPNYTGVLITSSATNNTLGGGSTTAWMLEMARALKPRAGMGYTYWLAWLDGEESFGKWSKEDSLYGSRALVAHLKETGELARVRAVAVEMAQAVCEQGLDQDGGLLYEAGPSGILDSDKHWWPQAEAVVGFLNAHQLSGQQHFLDAAENSWAFLEKYIVDHEHGEWFWLVSKAGVPGAEQDKVGPWKCPYHNSRTCFEVMNRLDALKRAAEAHNM